MTALLTVVCLSLVILATLADAHDIALVSLAVLTLNLATR